MHFSHVVSGLALLTSAVVAHPGHDISKEAAQRRDFLKTVKRADLSQCADKLKARGTYQRNQARRAATVEKARAKRGLSKRDRETVLATDHNKTSLGYTPDTTEDVLFGGTKTCVLTPEVTTGPYYVGGEYIRKEIKEDQEGVDTILDYQVYDVNTCEPMSDIYLEMWHANATGVYSGVEGGGANGNSDTTNIDKTWLRGIQKTDSEGVVQFESIFPGHYTGRAIHVHVRVHTNVTSVYSNGTLGNDVTASHIGQMFFDQDLITLVEATYPYTTNTQELSTNAQDGLLVEETATDGVDPFYEYVMLGDDVTDGVFAWIAFGINATYTESISPAAYYYADGGVTNTEGGEGGGPSAGGPPSARFRRH